MPSRRTRRPGLHARGPRRPQLLGGLYGGVLRLLQCGELPLLPTNQRLARRSDGAEGPVEAREPDPGRPRRHAMLRRRNGIVAWLAESREPAGVRRIAPANQLDRAQRIATLRIPERKGNQEEAVSKDVAPVLDKRFRTDRRRCLSALLGPARGDRVSTERAEAARLGKVLSPHRRAPPG